MFVSQAAIRSTTSLLQILAHGLIRNLTVVEQQADNGENSGKYEVVAGSRRFAALQRLAKQKKVSKTFAVPCHVVDPATATETSR